MDKLAISQFSGPTTFCFTSPRPWDKFFQSWPGPHYFPLNYAIESSSASNCCPVNTPPPPSPPHPPVLTHLGDGRVAGALTYRKRPISVRRDTAPLVQLGEYMVNTVINGYSISSTIDTVRACQSINARLVVDIPTQSSLCPSLAHIYLPYFPTQRKHNCHTYIIDQ